MFFKSKEMMVEKNKNRKLSRILYFPIKKHYTVPIVVAMASRESWMLSRDWTMVSMSAIILSVGHWWRYRYIQLPRTETMALATTKMNTFRDLSLTLAKLNFCPHTILFSQNISTWHTWERVNCRNLASTVRWIPWSWSLEQRRLVVFNNGEI